MSWEASHAQSPGCLRQINLQKGKTWTATTSTQPGDSAQCMRAPFSWHKQEPEHCINTYTREQVGRARFFGRHTAQKRRQTSPPSLSGPFKSRPKGHTTRCSHIWHEASQGSEEELKGDPMQHPIALLSILFPWHTKRHPRPSDLQLFTLLRSPSSHHMCSSGAASVWFQAFPWRETTKLLIWSVCFCCQPSWKGLWIQHKERFGCAAKPSGCRASCHTVGLRTVPHCRERPRGDSWATPKRGSTHHQSVMKISSLAASMAFATSSKYHLALTYLQKQTECRVMPPPLH